MLEGTGDIDNAGNENVPHTGQFLFDSQTGAQRTDSQSDKTNMFFGTQRGVDCDDKCKRMSRFYMSGDLFQIKGKYGIFQCTVNMDVGPVMAGKQMTD